MRTRIISAFPGVGKTFYFNNSNKSVIDSDSSQFSWIKDKNGNNTKERNPNFPQNYIEHIKGNIGKVDIILVSSHKEVREALKNNCLFYYLVYPDYTRKEEFLQRYLDRGSPESFMDLIRKNWDKWISELQDDKIGCENIRMILPNLSNEISHIICSENGEK